VLARPALAGELHDAAPREQDRALVQPKRPEGERRWSGHPRTWMRRKARIPCRRRERRV